MKKIIFLLFTFFLILFLGCSQKTATLEKSIDKSLQKNPYEIIKVILDKNSPTNDYKYYKTYHSDDNRLLAFTWVHKKLDKFYIKTLELYDNNHTTKINKFFGANYVKVINGNIYSCYGTSLKEPVITKNGVKVDWYLFDRGECKQTFNIKVKNNDDATKLADALQSIINLYPDKKNRFDSYRKPETKDDKENNRCSVDKIIKMKEIGLTTEEIKKICE
ncbi:hypothetical protein OWM07_06145 [Deferribacter thermophilus]|uniref:hypothetical protein n=1 Tax=Deferribacter thermophilus TaxID=53573 RepID=UPI003C25343D